MDTMTDQYTRLNGLQTRLQHYGFDFSWFIELSDSNIPNNPIQTNYTQELLW